MLDDGGHLDALVLAPAVHRHVVQHHLQLLDGLAPEKLLQVVGVGLELVQHLGAVGEGLHEVQCLSLWNFANISCVSLHESLQLQVGHNRNCPLGHATTKAQQEVQLGLILDVVVRDRVAILELLVLEDQSLLLGRDALLVLDDGLEGVDGGGALDFEGDVRALGGLHEDLHRVRRVLEVVGVAGLINLNIRNHTRYHTKCH